MEEKSEVPGENHQPAIDVWLYGGTCSSYDLSMVNTTKAVSLIPMCGKMDSIQLYVIKFVIDLLLAGGEKTTIQPSVLMEEESEVPGENHQPAISFNGRGIRSTRRKPPASHQF
jgi:hypothetical protein